MLVRRTRLNTVLVALLLASLTVLPSAKSQNRRGSQTAARHATKSPVDIPGPENIHGQQRPNNPAASRKNRTKSSVPGAFTPAAMADNLALLASNPRTSDDVGYKNRSELQTTDSPQEPFRDGIYSQKKQSKKSGSKNKQKPQFRHEDQVSTGASSLTSLTGHSSLSGGE
ncbi:hypothetical protein Btru_055567 [Bulinus truncatus]|nr:hypothetical protein Btru_055567 [Bulinus truncatus]